MKVFSAAGFLLVGLLSVAARAAERCGEWSAVVVQVVGNVEVMRADTGDWARLAVGDEVCLDEPIQAHEFSRADFLLPGDSPAKIGPGGSLVFQPSEDDLGILFNLLRGIGRIINRDSEPIRVTTPVANAGLRGTEIAVAYDGEILQIIVYEGAVDAETASGGLSLDPGQRVTVTADTFGAVEPVDPANTEMYWALFYPRIIDGPYPEPSATPPASGDVADFHIARAEARLRSGSVDAARDDIAAALVLEPGDPRAFALDAMIALSQGRLGTARSVIANALVADPDSATANIVQSYILAYEGSSREALAAATRAAQATPDSAVALSRLAMMRLANRINDAAAESAEAALAINNEDAVALAVLGFVALDAGQVAAARQRFAAAVAADPADPFPRVGLAIALGRDREPVQARQSLEIAVALDPNDSIVRSYMGKAYLDEYRVGLAETQLELAKAFDAAHPTPYLYGAWTKQSINQSVAAFNDITIATALNGNRTPFRPLWGIDDDQIVAASGLDSIYRSIGFELPAILAGSHAVIKDPWDYAGHQLVSDVASVLPRQQMTRVSEGFQARMLQPLNVRPFGPQIAQINLLMMDSVGPSTLMQAHSRSSFTTDGFSVQTSAVLASQETKGENIVFSGLFGDTSFNLSQSYYETGGFRENNDLEHRVATAFVQGRLSADTGYQAEFRSAETVKGDIALLYDAMNYDPLLRQREEIDSLQFGASHRLRSNLAMVASLRLDRIDVAASSGSGYAAGSAGDGGSADLQFQAQLPQMRLVSGVRTVSWDLQESTSLATPIPVPPFLLQFDTRSDFSDRLVNAYLYAHRDLTESLALTVGLSFDWLDAGQVNEDEVNPKLGLTWRPAADTFLRFAAYQTVLGPTVSKQLTQGFLEPTQVAGFGQYLFGPAGEVSRNYAAGFDHGLTPSLRISIDRTERSLQIPFVEYSPSLEPMLGHLSARESTDGVHLYWTPVDRLAFRAGWEDEDFDYRGELSPYSFTRLRTERVPLAATIFLGNAFSFRLTGTYARQEGSFDAPGPPPGPGQGPSLVDGRSRLWVVDMAIDYRLPGRLGTIEFGVKNAFDDNSPFQDTDPENPAILPERMVLGRFSLDF